jgi:Tat protein secretion system quality control protein TatD with DNase activity
MIMAAIGDESILARMDEIKAANHMLSGARLTSKEKARELSQLVPPTHYITAGLHSPETGPPEMVMELAYRLIVSEAEHIKEIRLDIKQGAASPRRQRLAF